MRQECGTPGEHRSSALWGKGSRGQTRGNALWGRGGRSAIALAVLAFSVMLPTAGMAGGDVKVVVPASLLQAATANPDGTFDVIVVGTKGNSGGEMAKRAANENGKVKRAFRSIDGAAATVTGKALLKLARDSHIQSITPDVKLHATALTGPVTAAVTTAVAPVVAPKAAPSGEMWRSSTRVEELWADAPQAPAIAIVDSGIDRTRTDVFGNRLVASLNFSSLAPTATGDAEGHGTMVAGIAAGASADYPGVSPTSPIIDLRTADANGQSVTSDVIAAADWILANKDRYNIRVANFSMAGASKTSFRFDPLNKAVERLWFAGIVVVAAAGNHGVAGGTVDMSVTPGNDPFIITVGALDQQETADPYDDVVAPWSAHGYSLDGFAKPDIAAPGRFMVSAVPLNSTINTTVPERIVGHGYIWMSGTSFAAPVVAGTAAQLLARHPEWTPDEVKGAMMLTAAYVAGTDDASAGVGELDAASAASVDFTPPNPNENFYPFVETDPATGYRVFNQASWSSSVAGQANWSSANWASASWSSASWSSANWASASWSSANWSSDVGSMMGTMASWSESTFSP
jgi:serine protease AprX